MGSGEHALRLTSGCAPRPLQSEILPGASRAGHGSLPHFAEQRLHVVALPVQNSHDKRPLALEAEEEHPVFADHITVPVLVPL